MKEKCEVIDEEECEDHLKMQCIVEDKEVCTTILDEVLNMNAMMNILLNKIGVCSHKSNFMP